jgi:hypothetical protein
MHSQASTCVLTFLLIASCAAAACDTDDTADASLTGPSTTGRFVATVAAAPAVVAPASRTSFNCKVDSSFDVRVNVNVRATQEVFIRGITFELVDASNQRVLPIPFPVTNEVNNSVTSVSVPTTHPIPFPGEASMANVLVPAGGSLTAPFRLEFDCGVTARGTLFVSVQAADGDGTVQVSRVSVPIGG